MKRFWLENYPEGIPHDIDVNRYTSIPDVLQQSVRDYPELPAFSNFGTSISFIINSSGVTHKSLSYE